MTEISSPVPMPGDSAPPISRAIYGMPMFATLLVADLARTTSWYTDGLGFITLFSIPGADGPVLIHLRRWQFQDLLVRPGQQPIVAGAGLTLSFAAAHDEIDALAARARGHGGGSVEGPEDTPWNTRDLTTVDPDGNVVIFTAARPPGQQDAAFSEQMRRWNAEQVT